MVLVHCTSPQCDLPLCEVTSFNTVEDFVKHGQTDRQGDSSVPLQTSFVGV